MPVPAGPMDPADRHGAAADLQRDVCGRLADRRRVPVDYPRELVEIQVLDDSTDETRGGSRAGRPAKRRQGHRHRVPSPHGPDRLQGRRARGRHEVAKGEYIAIFDADFIPTADFLQRTFPSSWTRRSRMVQARWGHINADNSLLTKIQSICSTRTSSSSTAAATAPGCSSTSTARPASGADAPSSTPAAGSTTR